MGGLCDLHFHSVFSDGTDTPEELAALAARTGLSAAVLTDHDTMAGVPRFLAAAAAAGVRAMTGLEISANVPGRTVHLLCYGCDPEERALADALRRVRDGREERNRRIFALLARAGAPVSEAEAAAFAGDGGVVGRPHIAAALVAKGFAADRHDAFRRYLARGSIAYAERFRLTPATAIALAHGAGGVVSLAHPVTTGYNPAELRRFVAELAQDGLDGIECLYTGFLPGQVEEYVGLAAEFGLVATGGTDYHGANKPNIRLGTAYGGLKVRAEAFDALLERIAEKKRIAAKKGTSPK